MTLDVNGYSDQFRSFVDFANNQIQADAKKGKTSIAQAGETTPLGDRTITANTRDTVGKWFRSRDVMDMNNQTREIFKNAIAEMFGGEKNIPQSVRKAMHLDAYDKGKPLTARRILAVKKAIDLDKTAKTNSINAMNARLSTFNADAVKQCALGKGWTQAELPMITNAAKMLCAATGVDEATAIEKLSTPGSKENRLMNYGGRFLESPANFANGLRLMDGFAAWYEGILKTMEPIVGVEGSNDYSAADTFTMRNFDPSVLAEKNLKGFEKFAFEELSINPGADLDATNMEAIFGFKNNKAMFFFGQGYGMVHYSTMANIPKEKRAAIYTAITAFTDPANSPREVKEKNVAGHLTRLWPAHAPAVVARLLRHFDTVEAMYREGHMTPEAIIKECFPGFPDKYPVNSKTLNAFLGNLSKKIFTQAPYDQYQAELHLALQSSGMSLTECFNILKDGGTPPPAPYVSGATELDGFDGTTKAAIKALNTDLNRPDMRGYGFRTDDPSNPNILPLNLDGGFGFTFPGQGRFCTNDTQQGRENIRRVADNVRTLCGDVHVSQANSVMMMLTQGGLSNLKSGISSINVVSGEHSPVEYSFAKNAQTGAVTITFSSPEELPFTFRWTATVAVDGTVTTTPMTARMKS